MNCPYRHMLPQGYILNRDKGAAAEDSDDGEEKLTMEEEIEQLRS